MNCFVFLGAQQFIPRATSLEEPRKIRRSIQKCVFVMAMRPPNNIKENAMFGSTLVKLLKKELVEEIVNGIPRILHLLVLRQLLLESIPICRICKYAHLFSTSSDSIPVAYAKWTRTRTNANRNNTQEETILLRAAALQYIIHKHLAID